MTPTEQDKEYMMIFINDTRTTKQKLDDLTDDSLLDRMEAGFTNFRRYTDPHGVMSHNWLWNRWIRSND